MEKATSRYGIPADQPEYVSPFSAALWCELAAHGSVGPHRQQRDPEIIVCISGVGQARIDDKVHAFHVGVLLYLPLGCSHSTD